MVRETLDQEEASRPWDVCLCCDEVERPLRSRRDPAAELWVQCWRWRRGRRGLNRDFQYATLLENRFFKLTAFKSSLLNAPWIKTILFTPILFHLPTIKLRWRMIHSKQRNCLGRGPLLKHEICRINPMAAGVMWYCCQTHPALVVNFIMTSYTILLKVYPTWIGKFIMTCYGCDDILAKCVTLRWN